MKVTSRKTASFPKLNWGINKGEIKDLPEDKQAQEVILSRSFISKVGNENVTANKK